MGRLKQKELPGTEAPRIQEIEDAADAYHEAKVERQKLTEEEKVSKETLIEKLLEHGLTAYETADGVMVTATQKTGVKTKRKARNPIDENQVEPEEANA